MVTARHREGYPVIEVTGYRDTFEALADRVDRLTVCRRDPHRFHEDKSEIVAELRALASRVLPPSSEYDGALRPASLAGPDRRAKLCLR